MSFDPGAIAAPTKEIRDVPTSSGFLAWKVSEADAMSGLITAWTSDKAFGTQVSAGELFKSVPM